jgi:predicted PurR-regulated permease PerM
MKRGVIIIGYLAMLVIPSISWSIETASRITDREIIERLTRLEEGQHTLQAAIKANAEAIKGNAEAIRQLRADMNTQFNRLAAIFTALVVAIIGFAFWDRRTMTRPFETRMSQLEGEVIGSKERLGTLIESLRSLSKGDEKLAEILRRFNLL